MTETRSFVLTRALVGVIQTAMFEDLALMGGHLRWKMSWSVWQAAISSALDKPNHL